MPLTSLGQVSLCARFEAFSLRMRMGFGRRMDGLLLGAAIVSRRVLYWLACLGLGVRALLERGRDRPRQSFAQS